MSATVKHDPINIMDVLSAADDALKKSENDYGQLYLVRASSSTIIESHQPNRKVDAYFRIFAGMHLSMILIENDRTGGVATTLLESPEYGVAVESVKISRADLPTPTEDDPLILECANSTFRFGGPNAVKTAVAIETAVLNHQISLVPHDVMLGLVNRVAQENTEAQVHRHDG